MQARISIAAAMCFALLANRGEAQALTEVPRRGPIPEAKGSFEYPSVAAAATALRAKAGVQFRNERGWLIAEDAKETTIWSFAPRGHPSFPSVVRRKVVEQDGRVALSTNVFCEASKAPCDALVREFDALNERALGPAKAR